MSIVRYNSTNEIVYHDKTHGVLVVHDRKENNVHLLTLPLKSPIANEPHCPQCGVALSNYFDVNVNSYRRNSNAEGNEEFPMAFMPGDFVHDDYFKRLAQFHSNSPMLALGPSSGLPDSLFNQGYFDRFFQKVPPYILGSGANAQVFKVVHVLKDIQLGVYAVKRISVGDQSKFLKRVLNEVLILYEMSVQGANENLIRYNHVWMEIGNIRDLTTIFLGEGGDGSVPYVFILQQYCDGGHLEALVSVFKHDRLEKEKVELERERRRRRRANTEEVSRPCWLMDWEIWKLFKDIANGVRYLHEHGILHRDLKPSNCLLETKYIVTKKEDMFGSLKLLEDALKLLPRVLVSDFGEGKFIDKQHMADRFVKVQEVERRGNTGTIEFTDPRLWMHARAAPGSHSYSYESDVYSLGMILCYLCVGELPFAHHLTDLGDPELIRSEISEWFMSLSAKEFHAWFSKKVEQSRRMLACLAAFESMIYDMLKGECPTPQLMQQLESLKLHFVVAPSRKLSVKVTPQILCVANILICEGLSQSATARLLRLASVGLFFAPSNIWFFAATAACTACALYNVII